MPFRRRRKDEPTPSPGPFSRVYISLRVEGAPQGNEIGHYSVDLSSPEAAEESTFIALTELAEHASKMTRDTLTRLFARTDRLLTDDQMAEIRKAVDAAFPDDTK